MPKHSWYTHDSAKRLILIWFKSEIFETIKATIAMGDMAMSDTDLRFSVKINL